MNKLGTKDREWYSTVLHGSLADVYRRQVASCRAVSTSLQHITRGDPAGGYLEARVLRRVTSSPSQIPRFQCWAVLKTCPSSFFILFNLTSTVKQPPRKKSLCTGQKGKIHTWNLFQSSATSTLTKNSFQISEWLPGAVQWVSST